MEKMILSLQKHIPQVHESDAYKQSRKNIIDGYKKRVAGVIQEFEKKVQAAGFALVQVQSGLVSYQHSPLF